MNVWPSGHLPEANGAMRPLWPAGSQWPVPKNPKKITLSTTTSWMLIFHNIQNHNVRYVLCARAQAFVDQVCRAGPSATGRRATFSKLNEKPGIVIQMFKPRASQDTCL